MAPLEHHTGSRGWEAALRCGVSGIRPTCNVAVELPIAHRVLLGYKPSELAIQLVILDDAVHLVALILLLLVCRQQPLTELGNTAITQTSS